MTLSRTVVGVHWLSDTVAAASLGVAVALATVVLAARLVPQALPARPLWPRPGRPDESGSWQVARASVRP